MSEHPTSSTPHTDWTLDTLRLYFERIVAEKERQYQQRFDAQQKALTDALTSQEKAVSAALAAAKEAVVKAESASDKRFEATNEFRGQLADQASLFLPRAEYQVQQVGLEEKITLVGAAGANNANSISNLQGRAAAYTAALGIGLTILMFVLKFFVKGG